MMARSEIYQSHLDRVSRSFAFCIEQLPEPLRGWVGLSYLLCRVVDTIEDAAWDSLVAQSAAFALFDGAMLQPEALAGLEEWQKDFPESLTEGERLLLRDAALLISDFHNLPDGIRVILAENITAMSLGMQYFCTTSGPGGLHLASLKEVNQYCFFVAGIVGELLAKLVAEVDSEFIPNQECLLRAHHFGLFLQKVNLLKDQVGDEKQGRHFIPNRPMVELSSQENARHALQFILSLPQRQTEFRRFCAWSLFLGLESLKVARGSQAAGQVLKVARPATEALLEKIETALTDSTQLEVVFNEMCSDLGWSLPVASSESHSPHVFPSWFSSIYQGPLGPHSLAQLGL